ncbi:arylesterase [Parahaliea sp. F7430]|uniref:Arylesterase n=1 Tax=Sediminihaliea albiluteola TaxID=2758564 RepID=A0A7W2TUZ0_9GAMM|nr:arylesterase [Sediminihaliea albiluteola]MBA6412441.1 arylesterase [Sediminihaliea albiluteola]
MQRFLSRLLRGPLYSGLLCLLLIPLAQAKEQSLLVLGDSISAAYGMSLEQGWVQQLAAEMALSHPDYQLVNASISGETTAGALRRLPALLARHQPQVVVIELGGNDGLRGFPIASLRKNLHELAALSSAAGARVLILPMEIPPNYGSRYTRLFRESFALAAQSSGAQLGPFILEGVATDPTLMQSDGIHPKAEAQSRLLDNIRQSIIELL